MSEELVKECSFTPLTNTNAHKKARKLRKSGFGISEKESTILNKSTS